MKLPHLPEKLRSMLAAQPRVGGLEISHSSLKYLAIKGARSMQQASITLPPGVIEKGKLIGAASFAAALKNLHNQIAPPSTPVNVVLIIPSSLVYVQAFSVPLMQPKEQEEAIDLNLQMISPGKIEESYYDWQEIKKNEAAGHLDLLGAFTNAATVDTYIAALTNANFNVVSVEFPALSLSRLVKERWQNPAAEQHHLLIYLNNEGLLIAVLKNTNLYFAHFTPWTDIVAPTINHEISFPDIQSFVTQEIQRVLAFYLSKSGHSLTNAILISPTFNYEIVQIAEKQFSLTIKNLAITELPSLSASWFPVLGAGLRGLISRAKDTFLSLAHVSAKTEYYQEHTLSLIGLCRNIVVGALIFVFISYLTVDGIFFHNEATAKPAVTPQIAPVNTEEIQKLRQEAEAFNQLTALVGIAKAGEAGWSPILSELRSVTGSSIAITRIFADRANLSLIITGTAANELAAINFKGRIERIEKIKSVSLPLSQIKTEGQESVSFTLNATLHTL